MDSPNIHSHRTALISSYLQHQVVDHARTALINYSSQQTYPFVQVLRTALLGSYLQHRHIDHACTPLISNSRNLHSSAALISRTFESLDKPRTPHINIQPLTPASLTILKKRNIHPSLTPPYPRELENERLAL